jgi:hypothetical protein
MSKRQDGMLAGFTAAERDYIRRELDMFFSTLPRVAGGFQLRPGVADRRPASRNCHRWQRGSSAVD